VPTARFMMDDAGAGGRKIPRYNVYLGTCNLMAARRRELPTPCASSRTLLRSKRLSSTTTKRTST